MSFQLPPTSYNAAAALAQLSVPSPSCLDSQIASQAPPSYLSSLSSSPAAAAAGSGSALARSVAPQFPLAPSAAASSSAADALMEEVDSQAEIQLLSRNLVTVKKKLTDLKTILCAKDASIQKFEGQIATLKAQIEEEKSAFCTLQR